MQIVLNECLSYHMSFMRVLPSGKGVGEIPSRNTDPKHHHKKIVLECNMGLLFHGKSNSDYKYFIRVRGSLLMVLFLSSISCLKLISKMEINSFQNYILSV